MHELFLKAHMFHDAGNDAYDNVLLLRVGYITSYIRISLTIPKALLSSPCFPPYKTTTNWAPLPAGPGTAKSAEGETSSAFTTFRVSTKDRKFVEEVEYRGWKIRVGDWLHLCNPDDPSKPIVGQVFKCYQLEEP